MFFQDDDEDDLSSHLSSVYDTDDDIKVAAYFFHLNGTAPNKKAFFRVEYAALEKELNASFPQRWKDDYTEQEFIKKESRYKQKHRVWFLRQDIWIRYRNDYESMAATLYYLSSADGATLQKTEQLLQTLVKEKEEDHKGTFSFITTLHGHFHLKEFKHIGDAVDIEDHYNKDFYTFSERVIEKLQKPKSHGLVLLHGKPGTGKTTYIRYLASRLTKRMIYFPPYMASHISSPELINFLMDQEESILVLEDADNVISRRTGSDSSAISNLLNLSDGLLGQCLHIPVICTFNMMHTELDAALLRKGRLLGMYEFKPLQPNVANRLASKIKIENTFTQPVSLAEIYNIGEETYLPQKQEIGFRK
ncbi:AAA family ATPase [Flavisolibacter ginsenosidimutans]|uniref:AAA family ATPase n=1 Tax=Flavisolibacter ginsenosidimutans TaxID=661481 RepID=A0A5B8UMJ1_9BACT|nr:AAA family ATPase [Flavisolibacter ginsenosidimutans]QEC57419.1 AAA family ATPase [Flavisolibacter ginsenosidimutans]